MIHLCTYVCVHTYVCALDGSMIERFPKSEKKKHFPIAWWLGCPIAWSKGPFAVTAAAQSQA